MAIVSAEVRFAPQLTAWFTANPTKVLQDGEIVYCSDGANIGKYVIGDNSTQLSALTFYGGLSSSGLTIGTTTITSGTNTRILYNNNGVVGEYTVTGTGTTAVLSTSPTFTTDITTPLINGGSAVGSVIQYKGTSGNGTSTVAAHQFLVGNNGATTAMVIRNDGKIGIGIAAPVYDFDMTKSVPGTYLLMNVQNTSTTGFSSIEALGDNGTTYAAINVFNSAGGVGTFYNNNTAGLSVNATLAFLANENATGGWVMTAGGFGLSNERVRVTTTTTTLSTNIVLVNTSTAAGGSLGIMRVAKGTGFIDFGEYASGRGGIWFNTATPAVGNFIVGANSAGTDGYLNGSSSSRLLVGGSIMLTVSSNLVTYTDAVHTGFGTTTGTKLGTATTQKIAFWNKTPIVQPTTAITGATLVSNAGTAITSTDTFGGYTLQQLAAILINTGLAA